MSTSLAAVFDGRLNQLDLRRLPTPEPRPGELLVRVLGCTLCGSDLHTVARRRMVATPTVLGHEIVGQIAAAGSAADLRDHGGKPLAIGDRVTWAIVASCGDCFYCRRGLPQKCTNGVKYGHEPLREGRELLGGLAEHCLLVPGTAIVRLPETLSLEVACPANCATATIAAAMEAAGDVRERSVVILGAGQLGLTAAAMATGAGAAHIICVERHQARRERAKLFGATHAVELPELEPLVGHVTGDHGADVVFELSGSTEALQAAWPCVRTGGTFVLVGSVFPGPAMSWPPEQIVRRHLTVRGIHNYAPRHLAAAVSFLEAHHNRFPFDNLVVGWFPLAEVEKALAAAGDPNHLRVGVIP